MLTVSFEAVVRTRLLTLSNRQKSTPVRGRSPTMPATSTNLRSSNQSAGLTPSAATSRRPVSLSLSDIGPALVASKLPSPQTVLALSCHPKLTPSSISFAYLEMSSCLCKMLFRYDLKLVNAHLDWESASKCYVMWWKAPVWVIFEERESEEPLGRHA